VGNKNNIKRIVSTIIACFFFHHRASCPPACTHPRAALDFGELLSKTDAPPGRASHGFLSLPRHSRSPSFRIIDIQDAVPPCAPTAPLFLPHPAPLPHPPLRQSSATEPLPRDGLPLYELGDAVDDFRRAGARRQLEGQRSVSPLTRLRHPCRPRAPASRTPPPPPRSALPPPPRGPQPHTDSTQRPPRPRSVVQGPPPHRPLPQPDSDTQAARAASRPPSSPPPARPILFRPQPEPHADPTPAPTPPTCSGSTRTSSSRLPHPVRAAAFLPLRVVRYLWCDLI